MTREADNIDRASDLALQQTEDSINEVRRAARPEQEKIDGEWKQKECDDCGDEIPLARLNLGKIRCVFCQSALERRRAGL
jgi:RNA polymerase-binding transcription factor DksA